MSIQPVAWRTWYKPSNNYITWQQLPSQFTGKLEPLVLLSNHQKIVNEKDAEIAELKERLDLANNHVKEAYQRGKAEGLVIQWRTAGRVDTRGLNRNS